MRVLIVGLLAVAVEAFVSCLSSSGPCCRRLSLTLHAERPDSGPDFNYAYDDVIDRRAAAEHARPADDLARQTALEDQERYYRQLTQRFVDTISSADFTFFDDNDGSCVDFLEFCRVVKSHLKGVGSVSVDGVDTTLFGRGEVTVADLRRLYDDLDTDRTGLLTVEVILETVAMWKSAVPSAQESARLAPQPALIGRRPDKMFLLKSKN